MIYSKVRNTNKDNVGLRIIHPVTRSDWNS